MKSNYRVVMTTFSKPATGKKIIHALLKNKVAACVQALPVKSSYVWKGSIQHDAETLLLIKTTAKHFRQIEKTIRELHDYETPEIISVPITAGSKNYLAWIDSVTDQGASK